MKISPFITILGLTLITTNTFGQVVSLKENEKQWTLGTILYSESQNYNINGWPADYQPNFFSGVVLKRNFNFFTVRGGIEYTTTIDKRDEPSCCDQITEEGYSKEGLLRLGIEKGFLIKKHFRPYLATEITGTKSFSNKIYAGGLFSINERRKITTNGFGLIQSFGLEYLISKRISLSIESRIKILYNKSYVNTTGVYDDTTRKTSTNKGLYMAVNRISAFTLNIHF